MKLKALALVVILSALFFATAHVSLEARHHNRFSINVGTAFTTVRPAAPAYVVSRPVYVQQPVVVYPQPVYEPVVVYPQAPVVVYPQSTPSIFNSISFGWHWGR